MKKFIPYAKLSKKKRQEVDRMRRADWGELCPVTRRPENPNAYNRKKDRRESEEDGAGSFLLRSNVV
ncbi:MAG: hypothetical protein GX592_01815 [Clostridiales bacterium]|nr:hypothetical protein [Clostridiales bacterium]